jgi:hypothetical protein
MIDSIRHLRSKVKDEGLMYFLTGYADPSIIPSNADVECLRFKELWEQVLPLLYELGEIANEAI